MTVKIDERTKFGVVFREQGEKMELKWFSWRERHLKITKTTYVWRERDGKEVIHKFRVTDGNDLYELSYRQRELLCFLQGVETDG